VRTSVPIGLVPRRSVRARGASSSRPRAPASDGSCTPTPSRRTTSRATATRTSRDAPPMSSTSLSVPSTTGRTCASHASRRAVAGLMAMPEPSVATAACSSTRRGRSRRGAVTRASKRCTCRCQAAIGVRANARSLTIRLDRPCHVGRPSRSSVVLVNPAFGPARAPSRRPASPLPARRPGEPAWRQARRPAAQRRARCGSPLGTTQPWPGPSASPVAGGCGTGSPGHGAGAIRDPRPAPRAHRAPSRRLAASGRLELRPVPPAHRPRHQDVNAGKSR
jgi:hypothetical protein